MKERAKDVLTNGIILLTGIGLGALGMALFGCGNGLPWLGTGIILESLLDPTEQAEDGVDGVDGEDGADSTVPGPVGPAGQDSTVPGPRGEPGITTIIVVHEPEEDDPPYGHGPDGQGPPGQDRRP